MKVPETKVKRVGAVALLGITGTRVLVEAATANQIPGITIIGLPDTAIAEAKQRVKLAAQSTGLKLSNRLVIINLSPAALPKHGSSFDLAIALAALGASGEYTNRFTESVAHLAELGLDGMLRRPLGLFTLVKAAKDSGFTTVMVPGDSAHEASLVSGINVIAVDSLIGAVNWYKNYKNYSDYAESQAFRDLFDLYDRQPECKTETKGYGLTITSLRDIETTKMLCERVETLQYPQPLDISDVVGQAEAVEALVVAAAGRHHISLTGPPGSGKSMLAQRLPTILPDLSEADAVAVTSVAALDYRNVARLAVQAPFENPHHTITTAGLVGGVSGGTVRVGAVTRASSGVLYLDEAPEFHKNVLDSLREPLEHKTIQISRYNVQVTLPANFQLVLASNPCPCGNALSRDIETICSCSANRKIKYRERLSGPLLDRIDVQCRMYRISSILQQEMDNQSLQKSEILKRKVVEARRAAAERFQLFSWSVNSDFPGNELRGSQFRLSRKVTTVLDQALAKGNLTLRGYDRVLRLGWTVADLVGRNTPNKDDIGYALSLRNGHS